MKYKMQIYGWLASSLLSFVTGYIQITKNQGGRFVYIGIAALVITALTYYITNKTDMIEKLIEKNKSKQKSQTGSNLK